MPIKINITNCYEDFLSTFNSNYVEFPNVYIAKKFIQSIILLEISDWIFIRSNRLIQHRAQGQYHKYYQTVLQLSGGFGIAEELIDFTVCSSEALSMIEEDFDARMSYGTFHEFSFTAHNVNYILIYDDGDYRINEWNKEHVTDGKYVKNPQLNKILEEAEEVNSLQYFKNQDVLVPVSTSALTVGTGKRNKGLYQQFLLPPIKKQKVKEDYNPNVKCNIKDIIDDVMSSEHYIPPNILWGQ